MYYFPNGSKCYKNTLDRYNVYTVELSKDEYQICDEQSRNRWSNKKKGKWGKGIINRPDDPYYAERAGLIGEMAFAKLTRKPIDLRYKVGGFDKDFTIGNNTIELKVATKLYEYRRGLVKSHDCNGKPTKINSDIYVFGIVENENKNKKTAMVSFLGYVYKDELLNMPIRSARTNKSRHYNYEVKYELLHDLGDFICLVG